MSRGFLYLAAIMDWTSRFVLAWRLSNTLGARFCTDTLEKAMATRTSEILLVGSVPFDTVEEVMEFCGGSLGARAFALPDGEIGLRKNWIHALPPMTYSGNPDLEPVHIVDQFKLPTSHDTKQQEAVRSTFRVKPNVTEITLNLPYGEEAIKSYEILKRLRAEGKAANDVPFQVCLPCTIDGTVRFFPDTKDHPLVMGAYERALQSSVRLILEHVPANDLVIQWDYCIELLEILAALNPDMESKAGVEGISFEGRIEKFTAPEYLAPMTESIPEEVTMGYHLCYGTWGGWPMTEVEDIGFCVRLANRLVANSPRRVDFFHLPAMRDADEAFFKPLEDLDIGRATIFLGLELADGPDEMVRRAEAARKYLPECGVAHYCGYGRDAPERVRDLIADLVAGAERLAE
ncbi:MAG: hypothetical protein F4178_07215 [Rhodospirillaceae bacterium]|nr:hypothetical protein [Rhodospirillaceae bacterium]